MSLHEISARRAGSAAALCVVWLAIAACGDNIEARLALDSDALDVVVGQEVEITARGVGYQPSARTVEWSVDDSSVARVTSIGALRARVTAIAPGTTNLRCADGSLLTSAEIRVRAPEVTSIAIDPPTVTLALGATQALTATATYDNGTTGDVTDGVTWAIDDAAIAEVTADGDVTARAAGATTVRATLGAHTASAAVTVTGARLTRIEVAPAAPSVPAGLTVQLVATAIYDDGSRDDLTALVTWSSQATGIATVTTGGDTAGRVTGVSVGEAEIRAVLGETVGTVRVAVSDAVLTAIEVAPATPTIPRGRAVRLGATGLLSNGTTIDLTAQATWTSSASDVATVDGGLVRGVALGTAVITAQVGALGGTTMVTISDAVVEHVEIAPTSLDLAVGTSASLTATALFSDGTVLDATTDVVWSSGDATIAQVSNAEGLSGRVTALAAGATSVSAALGAVSASIPVAVHAITLSSIVIEAERTDLILGTAVQLTATGRYSDDSTQDVTALATWSSSAPAVITVANADGSHGLATALTAGAATVTARIGEVTATLDLAALEGVLLRIEVSPPVVTLPVGLSQRVTATGVYDNGQTLNLTGVAAWTSADAAVATVSSAPGSQGTITAHAIGTTTVTARVGAVQATVDVEATAAALTRLQIDPAEPTLPAGTTGALTATGTYTDGTTRDLTQDAAWVSSDDAVVSVSNTEGQRGALLARTTGTATVTASVDGATATVTVVVTPAVLTELQVAPPALTLPRGTTGAVIATGIYSDGSRLEVTAQATWTSSAPEIAVVSSMGVVTARGVGEAEISASLDGRTATAAVTVTAATLTGLQIAPATVTLPRGLTAPLVATGLYTDGTSLDLTGDVTWSSSAPDIARVSNADEDAGTVTALELGDAIVTALLGDLSATVAVTVTAATLRTVEVGPTPLVLPRGTTGALLATGIYSDGTRVDLTASASWASDDDAIASVSSASGSAGVVTARNQGTTRVTARADGVSGAATVTVVAATLTEIQIEPAVLSLPRGLSAPLVATGVYSDATTLDLTAEASWTSSQPTRVSVSSAPGSAGRVTALELGVATITATVGEVSASIEVTTSAATLLELQVAPPALTVPRGADEPLTATGVYSDATIVDLTGDVTWTTSNAGVARVSNADDSAGLVTAIDVGEAVITAAFDGLTATAAVTVTPAALATIALAPAELTLPAGISGALTATGTYTDGTTLDLTLAVLWTSGDPEIARVSNTPGSQGLVTGVAPGGTTVAASLDGVTASVPVTITPAVLVAMRVTPIALTLPLGTSDFLTAIGIFSDGTEVDVTDQATWTSSRPNVAAVSSADGSRGLVTTRELGASTIRAVIGSISATADIMVTSAVLRELVILPTSRTMAIGESAPFLVTGIYTDNSTIDLTGRLAWRSSDTDVATVSNAVGSAGVVTAHAAGTATITASAAMVSVSATVTVEP